MPGRLQPWEINRAPARAHDLVIMRLDGWDGAGPVLFASQPEGPGAKEVLVRSLLRAGNLPMRPGDAAHPAPDVRLASDFRGRPLLFWGDAPGPAVSFSRAQERVYAALAVRGGVGVDVAYPEEFRPPYPFARVFAPGEWHLAQALCRGDGLSAAALLWALKEAALKARGEGFRRLAPREAAAAGPPRPYADGLLFSVHAGMPVPTWARPEGDGWLAVALVNTA